MYFQSNLENGMGYQSNLSEAKISIVDYGMGNVHSVMSVVKYLGYDAIITNDHKELLDSTKIILPELWVNLDQQ